MAVISVGLEIILIILLVTFYQFDHNSANISVVKSFAGTLKEYYDDMDLDALYDEESISSIMKNISNEIGNYYFEYSKHIDDIKTVNQYRKVYEDILSDIPNECDEYIKAWVRCQASYILLDSLDEESSCYWEIKSSILSSLRLYEPIVKDGLNSFYYKYVRTIATVLYALLILMFVLSVFILCLYLTGCKKFSIQNKKQKGGE